MFNHRLIGILAAVALLVVAALIVETRPAGSAVRANSVWHAPAYQGSTPSNPAIVADPPGVWHTPAYQGYRPDSVAMSSDASNPRSYIPTNAADLSAYYRSHPGTALSVSAADLSDFHKRNRVTVLSHNAVD